MAESAGAATTTTGPTGRSVPVADRDGADTEESVFLATLREATEAIERADIPYALIGGIASSVHGRTRMTRDIDLFVKAEDARRALDALAAAGFAVEETNPHWIYKATRRDIVVDIIFVLQGDISLDDEMAARATAREFQGVELRVLAPEDLIVSKAITHDEQSARHWHDALGVLAHCDLDWEYLLRRARLGPRRVLSLLIYAQSSDLLVPDEPIRALFELIYQRRVEG